MLEQAPAEGMVYVVSSDPAVATTSRSLLGARGHSVLHFGSAHAFVAYSARRSDRAACVLLDQELPDQCGLQLQHELAAAAAPPVVFIGKSWDVVSAVSAVKAGAVEFLTKPLDPVRLVVAVASAVEADSVRRRHTAHLTDLRQRIARLTPREKEVLPLLVAGLRNKQVAWQLGVTEVTIQVHRGQIMRKMLARSFAELVRMVVTPGVFEDASLWSYE